MRQVQVVVADGVDGLVVVEYQVAVAIVGVVQKDSLTLWWDQQLADTRTLDTHVKRIRRKIEHDPAKPIHLVTVRGIGFRFDP